MAYKLVLRRIYKSLKDVLRETSAVFPYIHFMCTFILNVINSFAAFLPSRNWHIKGDVNEPGTYIQLHMIFEMYCILKVNVTHKTFAMASTIVPKLENHIVAHD